MAFDIFHNEIVQTIFVICVMDLDDIFVSPACQGTRLLDKTFDVGGFFPVTRVDDFDSHGTLQFNILSIINGSHPAMPEHAFDAEICELATYH